MDYNNYHKFKDIKENPIVLNFKDCKYLGQIHLMLKEKFGLPEYYGENWDSLWDCLRYIDLDSFCVEIYGMNTLDKDLKQECKLMFDVFDDVIKEIPSFKYKILS